MRWFRVAAALALAAVALAAQEDPPALAFHRLRLEYTTTSDWTTLDVLNPAGILSSRLMETLGQPTRASAGLPQLALNQPLDSARGGATAGVVVDLAVAPEAAGEPLRFLLQKGSVNGSVVRLWLVRESGLDPIESVEHRKVVPDSAGKNPLEFSIDLSALRAVAPRKTQVAAPGLKRMLWAFYYPWYGLADWASPRLQDRPVTPYASNDPEAMAQHVEQAKGAGIDGFISSWWGPGHSTDQNLKRLLEVARERDFSVSIYFETLSNGKGREEGQIFDWLLYYLATYRDHPALFKVGGKPLVVVWASTTVPIEAWKRVFERLRERGLDAVYLAMSYDPGNLLVFDGLHQYGVFTIPKLAETMALAGRATRYYPLLADTPEPKIWAATVQPGYDDTLLPDRNGGKTRDREDGAFYRSTWEAALASNPDWIFITTWNEWWEHTHIEPSEKFGDQYLRITEEYARKK